MMEYLRLFGLLHMPCIKVALHLRMNLYLVHRGTHDTHFEAALLHDIGVPSLLCKLPICKFINVLFCFQPSTCSSQDEPNTHYLGHSETELLYYLWVEAQKWSHRAWASRSSLPQFWDCCWRRNTRRLTLEPNIRIREMFWEMGRYPTSHFKLLEYV